MVIAPLSTGTSSRPSSVPDSLCQRSRSLPRDVHESIVTRDLVEYRQHALWLRQHSLAYVRIELQKRIVYAQAVVLHPPLQQFDQLLLARQALADLQQLRRRGIHRVIESHFVNFSAALPSKCLFTEVRNLAMYVQILPAEVIQLPNELKNLGA